MSSGKPPLKRVRKDDKDGDQVISSDDEEVIQFTREDFAKGSQRKHLKKFLPHGEWRDVKDTPVVKGNISFAKNFLTYCRHSARASP